MLVVDD
jgi:CheY-like chemotaxis protein